MPTPNFSAATAGTRFASRRSSNTVSHGGCYWFGISFGISGRRHFTAVARGPDSSWSTGAERFSLLSTVNSMNGQNIVNQLAAVPWRDYVRLIRFPYHLSFVGVLLGVIIVKQHWSALLVRDILLLYVSFNVLLYGGLYTINAITDAEA